MSIQTPTGGLRLAAAASAVLLAGLGVGLTTGPALGSTPHAPKHSPVGIFTVKVALTGADHRVATYPCAGQPCTPGRGSPKTEDAKGQLHLDETAKNVIIPIASTRVPVRVVGGLFAKRTVNGSWHNSGTYDTDGNGSLSPFNCDGTIVDVSPRPEPQLQMKLVGKTYRVQVGTQDYGFTSANGDCPEALDFPTGWIGQGGPEFYGSSFDPTFKIARSTLAHGKVHTIKVSGRASAAQAKRLCSDVPDNCTESWSWHGSVKFTRVR